MKIAPKKQLLVALCAALSVSAALAAPQLYTMRIPSRGLIPATAKTPSGLVGDGVSKAGACAAGAASNCAIWGPASSRLTLTNNNLSAVLDQSTSSAALGSVQKSAGKWYWELTFNASSAGSAPFLGLVAAGTATSTQDWTAYMPQIYGIYSNSVFCASTWGTVVTSGSQWPTSKGDTVGIAIDMSAHSLSWYRNGALIGVACNNGPTSITPFAGYGNSAGYPVQIDANFGQANFKYPVPAGYNAGLW